MNGVLVDASVLLAILQQERGWEMASSLASGALISSVNLSEVAARLHERGFSVDESQYLIDQTGVRVLDFSTDHALAAAAMRPLTRAHGLSLADRACLATAQVEGLKVLTADRAWLGLAGIVRVEIDSIR
ncbi:type II toxin-antitoxin system VapC family toxin [Hyphomonas sp.]|uniref:type II toxin-antitoxin system VapC family toxin n=1 Tax=Hyphomonas sp. TaxID=87 RepID=UPI00391B1E3F